MRRAAQGEVVAVEEIVMDGGESGVFTVRAVVTITVGLTKLSIHFAHESRHQTLLRMPCPKGWILAPLVPTSDRKMATTTAVAEQGAEAVVVVSALYD